MLLTKKYKIHPTEEQTDTLWYISEQCRFLYNHALAERKESWEKSSISITYNKQQNDLPELKEINPDLKKPYSKTLQGVLKKLDGGYKSFFALWKNGDKDARPPNFRGKKYFFTIPYNQSGFKISDNVVTFSHKCNDVELSFEIEESLQEMKIKQFEIFNDNPYKAMGDFYISVSFEIESTKKYYDNNKYQAIDLGISKTVTAINTDCKFFEAVNPRPDKYWNSKIDKIHSRLDRCKKGSRRWKRLHASKRRMEKKRHNQIKDFQHKLSKKMVENTRANTIIIGDLNVKKMAKKPKVKTITKADGTTKKVKDFKEIALSRSTQNNGYLAQFVNILTYKAELAGKKVVKVDESYTSKACCSCGKIHEMPLSQRDMICDCGNKIDRDRNSSINIMTRYLSQNAIWTGYREFLGNLQIKLHIFRSYL
ncbi:RNA-guided endonuclease TnpB family protein [Methanolobus vulcani]|uniref:IS200/IS605 family element transposase accessory protein TnpB n=1 Tax=Methanolobus vulcani TaxID=38026 RepID=A0A7Z8KRN6_9EURY|nr:RNA-guided endonuclease TnpB family protein [Methanolobus vulcani]TQD29231.1 IS200/IS605 family element transposase accessory protein TnpB [Methanolobus vulcani]